MDLKAEKKLLKKEIDQLEDPYLIETIRKVLEYGKSKALKKHSAGRVAYFDPKAASPSSMVNEKLTSQEKPIEYYIKKNA
ncbi:MAG TPA: hypothetical protein VJ184_13195 [Chryseolinea sp.]|nr:hypothetical protein [Chryseolinea sp.]